MKTKYLGLDSHQLYDSIPENETSEECIIGATRCPVCMGLFVTIDEDWFECQQCKFTIELSDVTNILQYRLWLK